MIDNLLGSPNTTTYTYDPVGNLKKIYGIPAMTASRVSRLTRETLYNASDAVAGTITHAYDAVGNRTARTVANFSPAINGLGNQTLAYDQRDLIDGDANPANANPWYDLNGNSLADETGVGTGDIYDAENRLIQRGSGSFFGYDENGNRVKKVTPSGTTYYLVDDRNPTGYAQVLAEYTSVNSSVAPTVTYTIGAELISQNRSGTVRYYGYDGQGSVRFLTDTTISTSGGPVTQITDTYDYEAYGMLLAGSGATPNNYRYTGQQWDADLGMYYLRARYYQPGIGRFWTMDTYEGGTFSPDTLHKYLYCSGNPANGSDRTGFWREIDSNWATGKDAEQPVIADFTRQRENNAIVLKSVHGILGYASTSGYNGLGRLIPDLVDGGKHEIYDVKSWNQRGEGMIKLQGYALAFNDVDPDAGRASKWHAGTTYYYGGLNPVLMPGKSNGKSVYAVYTPTEGGVIPYRLYEADNEEDGKRIPIVFFERVIQRQRQNQYQIGLQPAFAYGTSAIGASIYLNYYTQRAAQGVAVAGIAGIIGYTAIASIVSAEAGP